MTTKPSPEQFIVSCVQMPNVSSHGEFDGCGVELPGGSRPTDPARVFLTRVFRNGGSLIRRAPGKPFANPLRESSDVIGIQFRTSFGRPFSSQSTSFGVGQTFAFRAGEGRFFDQHTLPLVTLPRTAKPHDYGPKLRVARRSPRESRISSTKECQMIEIGAREAEWPLRFHPDESALSEFLPALRAR